MERNDSKVSGNPTSEPQSELIPHSAFATCAHPGCTNRIHYTSRDTDRPYYCERHNTGRKAAMRKKVEFI